MSELERKLARRRELNGEKSESKGNSCSQQPQIKEEKKVVGVSRESSSKMKPEIKSAPKEEISSTTTPKQQQEVAKAPEEIVPSPEIIKPQPEIVQQELSTKDSVEAVNHTTNQSDEVKVVQKAIPPPVPADIVPIVEEKRKTESQTFPPAKTIPEPPPPSHSLPPPSLPLPPPSLPLPPPSSSSQQLASKSQTPPKPTPKKSELDDLEDFLDTIDKDLSIGVKDKSSSTSSAPPSQSMGLPGLLMDENEDLQNRVSVCFCLFHSLIESSDCESLLDRLKHFAKNFISKPNNSILYNEN